MLRLNDFVNVIAFFEKVKGYVIDLALRGELRLPFVLAPLVLVRGHMAQRAKTLWDSGLAAYPHGAVDQLLAAQAPSTRRSAPTTSGAPDNLGGGYQ